MAGAGHVDAEAGLQRGEVREGDRAEAVLGRVAAHRLVEAPQHGARLAVAELERAQRVAQHPGDDRRLDALAAHVADRRRPPLVGGEDVVEIAADLVADPHRLVGRRDLEALDVGQRGGQQPVLQGARDVRALLVERRALERLDALVRDRLDQLEVGAVHRARLVEAQPEAAEGAVLADEGDGHEGLEVGPRDRADAGRRGAGVEVALHAVAHVGRPAHGGEGG